MQNTNAPRGPGPADGGLPGSDASSTGGVGQRPRALFLANPRKRNHPSIPLVLERLAQAGIAIDPLEHGGDVPTPEQVAERARSCTLAVVCGGDGTLNRMAPALLRAGLPVGIIPAGTANDLARTLGVPDDAAAAAEVIIAGRSKTIDLGEVNGHPYFNVASLGMTVDLAQTLTRDLKRRFGRTAYLIAATRVWLSARPFRAEISGSEGTFKVRTLQIAVGNGRYYGGGLSVEETATIDDGRLHLYSLEMTSIWSMLPMLWAFRSGTHGRWATVRTSTGSAYEIRTRRSRLLNADGELITHTPCTFRVLPAALKVLVP